MASSSQARTKVFISYSHIDKKYLGRLQVHLASEVRENGMDLWDDTQIMAGAKWRAEIAHAIQSAKVAVMLVSADFLKSDFIHNNELTPLLSAAKLEGVSILPVLLKPCRYESTALIEFQFANYVNKPLRQGSNALERM
jgi:internalin A